MTRFMPRTLQCCSLAILALGVVRSAPSAEAPSSPALYGSGAPPFTVGVVEEVVLHDPKRGKDLPVKVYYPQGTGPTPVIVFSHGAGGSKNAFGPHARFWASHGYVSIHPTHADSGALGPGAVQNGGVRGALGRTLGDPKAWEDRAHDISFVIDSFPELERRVPELRGRLDRSRIAAAGHSYGAFTTMLIGGATVDLPGGARGQGFADPRPRALLVLSGQGTGQQGLTEHSWEKVTRPMLTMTGSRDRGAGGQGPDWKKQPFDYSPPGSKYHVFVEGATHFSFGGELGRGRLLAPAGEQETVFACIRAATLAFLDAYVKGDQKAKEYLRSEALPTASHGVVKLYRK